MKWQPALDVFKNGHENVSVLLYLGGSNLLRYTIGFWSTGYGWTDSIRNIKVKDVLYYALIEPPLQGVIGWEGAVSGENALSLGGTND